MNKVLIVNDGKRERDLQLVERVVVGRDPACDVTVDEDKLLSRRHAEFVASRDEVIVRDLGSRNGIFVNGTRTAECLLNPGDVVQIGSLRVQYVTDRGPTPLSDGAGTALIRSRAFRADIAPVVPPAGALPVDDEAPTRAFRAPTPVVPSPDDEATQFVPKPPAVGPPPVRLPIPSSLSADPRPLAGGVAGSRSEDRTLNAYVFVQLAVLATIVFAGTSVPLLWWRTEDTIPRDATLSLLMWPVVPLLVALVAAYLIASLVTRRFHDALSRARHDMQERS